MDDRNRAEVLLALDKHQVIPPHVHDPQLPRPLERIVLKCLQRSPADRYASARELADDLSRFLENDKVQARPPGLARRSVRWMECTPVPALIVVATVLCCLLIGLGLAIGMLHKRGRGVPETRKSPLAGSFDLTFPRSGPPDSTLSEESPLILRTPINKTTRQSDPSRRRRLLVEQLEGRRLLAVLFADSFESGQWAGNWVEDSQNDWFTSGQRATNGPYSAEVDGRATDATLTLSNPIDLSGYSSAELTFDWLIENGFDGGEHLSLDVSSDGGANWQADVRRLSGNVDAENTWHSETVNLTPYASSNLLVRFRAKVSRSNEDANLDNVRITGSQNSNAVTTISYPDFSDAANLNLIGDAIAPFGANNAVRLTPHLSRYKGGAWHDVPQAVATSFETEFEFQVGADGSGGFAFVIQNVSAWTFGSPGGYLGYGDVPNSLAIEFDTNQNPEYEDVNNNHVAIHTNGVAPNAPDAPARLATVTPSFDINDGQAHHVKVKYTPGLMAVYLDHDSNPALTVPVDLAELLNLDAGQAWLGFTAISGGTAQSQPYRCRHLSP